MALVTGDAHTVLVADDSDDIRELLRLLLELRGCSVIEAENGLEAVARASETRPDLILMDLSMPVLDGYAATRRIHEQPQLSDVPVVAVSAFCDTLNRGRALAAGCVECVAKPVDLRLINELLNRHLRVN
jgi:two-component system cell cycle response regulator DivK